ncbi:hypothetical protein [Corynebacterium atrinae]|uniref:hypothetical protein n=1 Tax=Corynebacterium atrinae TaxID=1336740 RepID=UPI0025B5B812|nr:hypothetical protein [Corynebacterium atrinae]
MPEPDPLEPLLSQWKVADVASEAVAAIATVHRRPVSLRRSDLTGSESVLRGARTSALIDDPGVRLSDSPTGGLGSAISVYSLLAPDSLDSSARTFLRAPLQILARMDVLAGGNGHPVDAAAGARLQGLSRLVSVDSAWPALLPVIVHGEILAHRPFGPRSGGIARAASRLAAVANGFDPRGLAVPETYLNRHRDAYLASVNAGYGADFARLVLQAWVAGAVEAEAIARAV